MRLRRSGSGSGSGGGGGHPVRTAGWVQLLHRVCDLLGVGWETNQNGRLRLRAKNPPKGSVLYRLDRLEARVAEVEAGNTRGAEDGRR